MANGGYLVTPHVVQTVRDGDGNIVSTADESRGRQVVSTEVCRTISEILEQGVAGDGGARNAYVAGYRIAAKTGTSEKVGDNRDAYICSCVAYAPAEAPRVAALIMVDEPTVGSLYGSTVAAPYISKLMETILPYMGVEAVYTDAELETLAISTPNLVGYTRAQAEARASDLGLTVRVVGEGSVVRSQSPQGGTRMEKENGVVVLYMGEVPESEYVSVPKVTGMTAAAANRVLIGRGLNIRIIGTKNHLTGTEAVVVTQSPAAGEQVLPGTVVTLTFKTANDTE